MLDLRSTWARRKPIETVLVSLALVIAALLGSAVTSRGAEVFSWLALPFGALLVLARPVLGMLSVAATLPLEDMAMFAQGVTFTRALGMGVFGAWLSYKLMRRESWQPILTSSLFKVTICLLALILASTLWSWHTRTTLVGLFSVFNLFLWSLLVADLASSWHRIVWLVKVLMIAGVVLAILVIQQYFVGGARRAGEGLVGGINATAYVMVIILPFAFYLIRAHESGLWRLIGFAYVPVALVGVAVTFSRASYVILALAILIEYRETIGGRSSRSWLLLLSGLAVIAILLASPDLILERAETIGPYLQSAISGEIYDEGLMAGRGFVYRIGFAIFRDHPLLGVGYGNFERASAVYKYYVPGFFPYGSIPSHSSYLSFLAELGLPGLLLWIVMLGIALRNLIIAWATLSRTKPSMQVSLVQAVTYSFLLQLGYGFARPNHREKTLWLVLGLSVALRRLAEQSQELQNPADDSSTTILSSAVGAGL